MPSRTPSLTRTPEPPQSPLPSPGSRKIFGRLRKKKDEDGEMWGCVGVDGEEGAKPVAKKVSKKASRSASNGGFGSWLEEEMGEFGLLDHGGRRGAAPSSGEAKGSTRSNPDLTTTAHISYGSTSARGTMPRTNSSHSNLSSGSLHEPDAWGYPRRMERGYGIDPMTGYVEREHSGRGTSRKPSLESLAMSYRSSNGGYHCPSSHTQSSASSAVSFSMGSSGHSSSAFSSPTTPDSAMLPPMSPPVNSRIRSDSVGRQLAGLAGQLPTCPEVPERPDYYEDEFSQPLRPPVPPRARSRSMSGPGLVQRHEPPPMPPLPDRWGPSPLPAPRIALPPIPTSSTIPVLPPHSAVATGVVYRRVTSGFPEDVSPVSTPEDESPSATPTGQSPTRRTRRYDFI